MTYANDPSQVEDSAMGGAEGSETKPPANDSDRVASSSRESREGGNESAGLPGSDRTVEPALRLGFVAGKIIAQLIKQEQDRLGEMHECVEWYQREVSKKQTALEELLELQFQLANLDEVAE